LKTQERLMDNASEHWRH